jgi:radical SAM-linked protein
MQRLRVRFTRGPEIKYISHLDIMRLWQRALTRAGIDIAYSAGFNPHPRISLAVPLAIGVTSEAELMDVILEKPVSPHYFTSAVSQQLPPGMTIAQVVQVAPELPSLQSQVRFAEYAVEIETGREKHEIESAINALLSRSELSWEHRRDTGAKKYDLRALIDDLWLMAWRQGSCTIGMRLRCDSAGSGRPEQVALALGFDQPPLAMHRTRLIIGGN